MVEKFIAFKKPDVKEKIYCLNLLLRTILWLVGSLCKLLFYSNVSDGFLRKRSKEIPVEERPTGAKFIVWLQRGQP